ncbi:MAG: glycosyltransferase [Candidatus Phocaeicola faecigallinarum]|uniref:Glycosyltransferase n=1 Tax=Candidatus Phocaeicola faecigallinarum TaxID=2838732 RepID=A0A948TDS0_9BACT|nr:glycosyltransferase [Candidatus Phocaeicola faecigallinarum]
MEYRISVIVPVYGVEKFLDYCIESIVNQTYKNLEIILVDDGSPDNCPKMCDEWAIRDKRIKTVHRKNGGLSCARNTGLSIATGDYISFVDSDDWIDPITYSNSLELIQKYNSDVIQYNYALTKNESYVAKQIVEKIKIYENKDIIQNYLEESTISGSYSMCRILAKKELFKDLLFREGKINEDIDFKYKLLSKAKRMIVSNQIYYYYRQGNETTSSGGLKKNDFDLYESANILWELAKNEEYGSIRRLAKLKKNRTAFSLLSKIAIWGFRDNTLNKSEIITNLTKEHRKNLFSLIFSPMPFSRKICAVLLAININCLKVPMKILIKLNLTKV